MAEFRTSDLNRGRNSSRKSTRWFPKTYRRKPLKEFEHKQKAKVVLKMEPTGTKKGWKVLKDSQEERNIYRLWYEDKSSKRLKDGAKRTEGWKLQVKTRPKKGPNIHSSISRTRQHRKLSFQHYKLPLFERQFTSTSTSLCRSIYFLISCCRVYFSFLLSLPLLVNVKLTQLC